MTTQAPPQTPKKTLMIISHTHWDREWYLTFQQFRFKLVRLVDRLLTLLDTNPEYAYFMLDGQTIVLEDYLEIRPERRADLQRHVQSGRLLIGPWYVLADQFLVSGEAHIQNLLRGSRTAREFGNPMNVGYIPDPFGHISQMPQILRGFGIDSAVFWRGVGPEINQIEFVWMSPDGSSVDGVHLPSNSTIGGYSTALAWNKGVDAALAQLKGVESFVVEPAKSNYAVLMNGDDHIEPSGQLPATLKAVQAKLADQYNIVHGTLPMYLELARQSGIWKQPDVAWHVGEFRSSNRAHLLPGVLSARIPLKQYNSRLESLLEREAGAYLAWANSFGANDDNYEPAALQALYQTAWKYLLQNHPHDSICGCSIDQVHEEMYPRFAQTEQITQELIQECQRNLVGQINTANGKTDSQPLVIFNSMPFARTEVASLPVVAGGGLQNLIVEDTDGTILPHHMVKTEQELFFSIDIPAYSLAGMSAQAGDEGRMMDYTMASVDFVATGDPKIMSVRILAVYQSAAPTDKTLMAKTLQTVEEHIAKGIETFRLDIYRYTSARLRFLAKDVPAIGYKTFYLRPRQAADPQNTEQVLPNASSIENEFYQLSVDNFSGLFSVLDKKTGVRYNGLNRFRDGSDAGDEYNYSPASQDLFIDKFADAPKIRIRQSALQSSIRLEANLELPTHLSSDRQSRSSYTKPCAVTVTATLVSGQPRIDFVTTINNQVEDHRLQVLFPANFAATNCEAEQAFDVVERSTSLPVFDHTWREDPQSTAPQKTFVSIYDKASNQGLTVINQGLPEYEIVNHTDYNDKPISAIGLTLLRCVGWLSRTDLATRRGDAGPSLPTPGAQLRGEHTFHYAVMPHAGTWQEALAHQQSHAFNHPLTGQTAAVQTDRKLPSQASFVELQPSSLILSTIKPSESGKSLIIRLWNSSSDKLEKAQLRFHQKPIHAAWVNLAENQVLQTLAIDSEGWLSFELNAKQIVTIQAEF